MRIIITGCAGFIGMHATEKLLGLGHEVIGIDNINDYYSTLLKEHRLKRLKKYENFVFYKADVYDKDILLNIFKQHTPHKVIHLAAQAGVRYSLINPDIYVRSNINGFMNILESCRHYSVEHLVYASSSSVYGNNSSLPFSEYDSVDNPASFYAVTKKANELMAYTYSHLYQIPTTGLRFFTVYGPWGRPDMAFFKFTKAIIEGDTIEVFNNGNMIRDFTYIDDIVEGVVRILNKPPIGVCPYNIFNVGNGSPVNLIDYIGAIEKCLGKESKKKYLPMQLGDIQATLADTTKLKKYIDFNPSTSINLGIKNFIDWYMYFYEKQNVNVK